MSIERLHWNSASSLPDADITVLLWVQYEDGETDWASGWWDGEAWRFCESGGLVVATAGRVLHWAEPAGPGNAAAPEDPDTAQQPATCQQCYDEGVNHATDRLRALVEAVRDANRDAEDGDTFRLLKPGQERAWMALLSGLDVRGNADPTAPRTPE